MAIKSVVFSLVEEVSLFYCLLNHIDGGIRILKHSDDQWTEDKYVSQFLLYHIVPHDRSPRRVGPLPDGEYTASHRCKALH